MTTTTVSWHPLLDESPCDLCPHRARCRDEQLACEQLEVFTEFGGRRWRQVPREPSREIYGRIFSVNR
jgi:hypothetical protein